jgi:[acyl-carrier-protein] S-malonyltransferase
MMDWSTTAFLFPGQNSQVVGMGKDIAAAYPTAKAIFDEADDVLGGNLAKLCFEGPEDALNDTYNTQPAVYVCSAAILAALQDEQPDAQAAFLAGHSLGEFTALMAAESLTFADGLRLVRERGRLMRQAGEENPGAMAALLGTSLEDALAICKTASEQTGKPVVVANDNCPGQIVISGDVAALEAALKIAKARGTKRTVRLAVSIAAHSPLMQAAADDFRALLDKTNFKPPRVPVYGNANAEPITTVEAIRAELNRQLVSPVLWTKSMQQMIAAGAQTFVEIGPGDVLTGLVKRIDRSKNRSALNDVKALQNFTEA